MSAPAPRGDWFAELCERRGLVALPPMTAARLTAGLYVFDASGTPYRITRVRFLRHGEQVRITRADGWEDTRPALETLSFVARLPI